MSLDTLDQAEVAELVCRLDVAAQAAGDEHEVLEYLKWGAEETAQAAGALALAFEYRLTLRRTGGREDGFVFVPKFTSADGRSFPIPVSEVPEEVCRLWAACAEEAASPVARARLHDLLFERRWGNGRDHARAAAEAYVGIVRLGKALAIRRADALVRALELARRTGQGELADRVISVMVEAVKADLAQAEPQPGVVLELLEALTYDIANLAELEELLAATRRAFRDAFTTEQTIALQRYRVRRDSNRCAELDRERVKAWVLQAESAEPLVRLKLLERAADLARRLRLADLAEQVTTTLQQIQPGTLGLQTVEAQIGLSAEDIERYLAQFTEAASWQEALARLVAAGPPSGAAEENRQQADAIAGEFVYASLLPKTRLGGDGLPRFTARTPEEAAEVRLADQEVLTIQVHGLFLGEALERIGAKFEPILHDELQAFFQHPPHVPSTVAAGLTRAFEHYFRGDYEAAAYLGNPRIETIARNLVLALGLPVYRVQRAKTPGQYPGLGVLLDALSKAGLDPSWHRFLWTFLASPVGLNYRNELAHGFVEHVDRTRAALVLIAVLYLAALEPPRHAHEESGPQP